MIWYVTLRIYYCLCFNNNNSLHLYSAFLGGQSVLHRRGGGGGYLLITTISSIHLDDDVTAAILRHNDHHTPAYWWREDRVMKPISVWRWLGGHDAGVTSTPGLHTHFLWSQRGRTSVYHLIRRKLLVDSIVSPSLYWGVRTHTDHRGSTRSWPHFVLSQDAHQ